MTLKTITAALALACAITQPALADPFDPCLVGSWQADPAAFGQALGNAIGDVSAQMTGGEILLDVHPDGLGFMYVVDVVIDYRPDGLPASILRMGGTSSTQMNTAGVSFWVEATEYVIEASAEVMGMVIDVPVAGTDPGNASGTYTCNATELAFVTDGPYPSIAPLWHRIDAGE